MPKRLASRTELAEWLQPLAGVRAILALGSSGSTSGESGTSADVSDPDDRSVLLTARSLADVALTGGATARAEQYKPSERIAIAILTRDASSVAQVPAVAKPGSPGTIVIEADPSATTEAGIRDAIADLKSSGHSHVLFEGGLNLLNAAIAAGVVDQVLLSAAGGVAESALVADLFEKRWHLADTANFGQRWLYKLAK